MALRWGAADSAAILDEHGGWLALADDENIEFAAKTYRDLLIFMDRRVVMTDTQGVFRKKTEYHSILYRGLSRWSVESRSRGLFDGADLKLWISSQQEPLVNIALQKDGSARDVMELLSRHAL